MQTVPSEEQPRSWVASGLTLVAMVAGVLAAGAAGAMFLPGPWYEQLAKPPLTPPNWIFGPVWTALYVLIGIAGWLILESGPRSKTWPALAAFAVQLLLNGLWSPLFFGLQQPAIALVDIGLLWAAIATTIWLAASLSRPAAWLLAPYLAWVSFAVYLNAGIVWLNWRAM